MIMVEVIVVATVKVCRVVRPIIKAIPKKKKKKRADCDVPAGKWNEEKVCPDARLENVADNSRLCVPVCIFSKLKKKKELQPYESNLSQNLAMEALRVRAISETLPHCPAVGTCFKQKFSLEENRLLFRVEVSHSVVIPSALMVVFFCLVSLFPVSFSMRL